MAANRRAGSVPRSRPGDVASPSPSACEVDERDTPAVVVGPDPEPKPAVRSAPWLWLRPV